MFTTALNRFLLSTSSSTFLRPLRAAPRLSNPCRVTHLDFRASMATAITPPVAKKIPLEMEMFGDVRVDNYYWLRDDSRSDPEILAYLSAENDYADRVMAGTKKFEEKIYDEMRGRIKESDITAPKRKGGYYYYKRTLEGKEYSQHCRCPVVNVNEPPSVHDTFPFGDDAVPDEHVILDENVKAQEHSFYSIGNFKVSPNNKLVVYTEDVTGNEIYTAHVINAETREPIGKPLVNVTSYVEWAGDDALLYMTLDETLRPYKVWLHKLGSDQSEDICLYEEKDDMFSLDITASESKKFLFVGSESKCTRFTMYFDVSRPGDGLKILTPRIYGIDTSVSHRGNHFFIIRRSSECWNSEILACPVDDISATTVLIPHKESVKIQEIQLFSDNLVVLERENGLQKIVSYRLPEVDEPLINLPGGQAVDFVDPSYSIELMESQFNSSILRYFYSSLKTPFSVYDYDMNTGVSVLKKIETVLGGFDASKYVTERKWAVASDGTQIPMSIVYNKDLVKLDGSDPLLLYGYGSYEVCIDPCFRATRLSLLERGMIYVIAHIRGGGEMGREWYEKGKFLMKKNTFTDFISCAEYLIKERYCSKDKLCVNGRSAGGLLIGAVLNMRPDLFKTAVLGVPFVDVVTTMLDPTIPLTTSEWEEWGDPRKEEFYKYMKSYSPVDNIGAQNYPHILVTAGLNDTRVLYSEPAKYVAKLRATKTVDNLLLFKCELTAGHSSKSGRFEKLQEDALIYTFILKTLNLIPDGSFDM
ncbi:unnamed protein product [Rhodiola kirilowii]